MSTGAARGVIRLQQRSLRAGHIPWTASSVLLAACVLGAQSQPNLDGLTPYIGGTVAVHDVSGGRTSGRLIDATAAGLTVSADGVRRVFQSAEIASVGVLGDPLWDGAAKGAAIGGVLIALGSANVPSCDRPCFRKSVWSDLLGVVLFAAIGGWIDHAHERESTVYVKGP